MPDFQSVRLAEAANELVSGSVVVVDGALLAVEGMRADASRCAYLPHQFRFDGATYCKPGIAEVDLECADVAERVPASLLRLLRGVGAELARALELVGLCEARRGVAIKLQRNRCGAFPSHYDNAGPPSSRAVTAILYMGGDDEGRWARSDGGELVVTPFLARARKIAPRFNRLVLFRSDTVLHSVEPWRAAGDRLCASFWFESQLVNAPSETTLTRDALRFADWDQAAAFFQSSPLQRALSRAVYADEYARTLALCVTDATAAALMQAAHARQVAALEAKLRPLILELRRRVALLPPPAEEEFECES